MKLTEIKNYIEDFTFYGGVEKGERMDLRNVAYQLIETYRFAPSIKNIEENDLDMLLDNLYINNEFITDENIDGYVEGFIESLNLRQKTINEIKSGQKFMLLNYYNIDNKLTPCNLLFKTDYNAFE